MVYLFSVKINKGTIGLRRGKASHVFYLFIPEFFLGGFNGRTMPINISAVKNFPLKDKRLSLKRFL